MSTTNHSPSYRDIEADMIARWRPSASQIAAADQAMNDHPGDHDGVYTAHLLIGKHHGFWTTSVTVVAIDGVHQTRDGASDAAAKAAAEYHAAFPTEAVQGGYTWHPRPGDWAVWEDILVSYND